MLHCRGVKGWGGLETRQTRKDKQSQNKTKQDKTRQNKTKQDKTRQNKTKQDKTRQTRHTTTQDYTDVRICFTDVRIDQ